MTSVFHLKTDNSISALASPDPKLLKFRQQLKENFGNDRFIMVVFPFKGNITPGFLKRIDEIQKNLNGVSGVERTDSILSILDSVRLFRISDIILRAKTVNEILNSGKGFSESGLAKKNEYLSIVISISDGESADILSSIMGIIEKSGIPYHISGEPVINNYLKTEGQRIGKKFIPLYALFSVIILFIIFRSFLTVMAMMLTMAVALVVSLGVISFFGFTLTIVSNILPLIIMVVSVETMIHTGINLRTTSTDVFAGRVNQSYTLTRNSIFFSVLTTQAGFLSFLVSPMSAMLEMGVMVVFSLVIVFLLSVFFLPVLLSFTHLSGGDDKKENIENTAKTSESYVGDFIIVTIAGLLIAGGVWRFAGMTMETDNSGYLGVGSKLKRDTLYIRDNVSPIDTVEVIICAKTGTFNKFDNLKKVENSLDVFRESNVQNVGGPFQTLRVFSDVMGNPGNIDNELVFNLIYRMDTIKRYINKNADKLRLSLFIRNSKYKDIEETRKIAERDLSEKLMAQGLKNTVITGGISPEYSGVMKNLVVTLIYTTLISLLSVMGLLFVQFRKMSFVFLGIFPSVFSVLMMYALMEILGVTLDAGSVLISAVTIGISVDATIHLLKHIEYNIRIHKNIKTVVDTAVREIFKPVISSSLVISSGFAAFAFSSFPPLRKLGIFTGAAILTSFFATMFIVPALFRLIRVTGRKKNYKNLDITRVE